MGEKAPTLAERMNLTTEKQRTPEQTAAQMQRVAEAIARRAIKSKDIIERSNTSDNSIKVGEYTDGGMITHDRVTTDEDGGKKVRTRIVVDKKYKDRFGEVGSEFGKRVNVESGGQEKVAAFGTVSTDNPERTRVHGDIDSRTNSMEESSDKLTQNQIINTASSTIQQTRQEIANRENAHKASVAEKLSDTLAA
jgi:hypothetical protein